jgi:hypothetical protein
MLGCPGCKKANNIYALHCAHCGVALTPPAKGAPESHVREPCPRCSHGRFVVVSSVMIPDTDQRWRLVPLPVLTGHVGGGQRESAGTFHAYVCLECGHTQWFATNLAALEQLATKLPNARVITVDAPNPYR